jgi:hypothetical protein
MWQGESIALQCARVDLTQAQMNLTIAEVSDLVQRRVEKNHKEALRVASDFRGLATVLDVIMQGTDTFEPNDDQVVFACRIMKAVTATAPAYRSALDDFDAEHALLVEKWVRDVVHRFATWAPAKEAHFRELLDDYRARFDAGLREDAERQAEITREWSVCDGDCL